MAPRQIKRNTGVLYQFEYQLDVVVIFFLGLRGNEDDVLVYERKKPLNLGEKYVGRVLEGYGSILESELHALEPKELVMRGERHLVLISVVDLYYQ